MIYLIKIKSNRMNDIHIILPIGIRKNAKIVFQQFFFKWGKNPGFLVFCK